MGSLQHGALSRAFLICSAVALGIASNNACAAPDALPLSSCEDPADFSAALTPDEPAFDFAAWEATAFAGARVKGSSLRWHVRPSTPEQTSARVALTRPLPSAFARVQVWVKNPNAHDLSLRLEIIDADGARYLSPPVALVEEIDWREITFDLPKMTGPAEDPFPGLDMPVTRLALLVEGLLLDRPHTIYLDEITATPPDISITLADLTCQTSLGPGESLPVRAGLSPASAVADARVVAQLTTAEGGVLSQAPVRIEDGDGEAAAVSATLGVPRWLAPGRYEVRLAARFAQLAQMQPMGVVIGGAPPTQMTAGVAAGLSPPAILLGDTNYAPLVEELRGRLPAELTDGVQFVGLPATTDVHPFAWAACAHGQAGEVGFAGLDRRAAAVLSERPDAALVLQVFLGATSDWKSAHPDHLQQFGGAAVGPPAIFGLDRTHADIVSAVWQNEAAQRLRALVLHVADSPWGHRVIGYELQAGDLGAWRPWGASLGIAGEDTTPVRQTAFMDWLHERYPDVNDLRDGWLGRRRGFGQPRAGFEAARVPTPLEDAPEPSLYDPAADQPMIDLLHFKAEAPADALLSMAAAVRDEAPEGTLVGACYGHLLSQARANDWLWPHTALSRVLESGTVDFLTGPQARIDDVSEASSLGESIRRAGALYLERSQGAPAVPEDCGAMAPAGEAGSLERIPSPSAPSPGTTVVEVIDDLSARYLSGDAALPRVLLTRPISDSIPHETCLLRDLLRPGRPQGRLYVFRDVFTIEPEDGRLLARNTCGDDSLLVWIYAPGAIDRFLITGRTMQYLTGIKLSPLAAQRSRVTVTPETELLTPFGFPHPISPVFISADEDAEWLGTIAGTDPARCGLALRRFAQCTSVFSVAPPTEEVIHHLARRSGIDITSRPVD